MLTGGIFIGSIMLDFISDYFKTWSTHMDYVGQKKAERIFQIIVVAHGILGFIIGYVSQQLSLAVYTLGIGFVISCLVVLPPWPYFRRDPLRWQKAAHPESSKTEPDSASASKKKKK